MSAAIAAGTAILASAVLTGCQGASPMPQGSAEVRLSQGERSVEVGMTGILRVELVGNDGTGYGWRLAANDPAMFEPIGQPSVTPLDPGIHGGRTITSFEFRPLCAGKSQLVFEYVRPWLTNEPPGRTARVDATITGGGA